MNGITINHYIFLATVLFAIGAFGVMYRRNAIIVFACIELMLNAVNLMLVAFSRQWATGADAQVFVFFIMAVAAAEVAIGLAILMMIFRNTNTTDIDVFSKLKG